MSAAIAPGGLVGASGAISLQVIRRNEWISDDLRTKMRGWRPESRMGQIVRDILTAGLTPEAAQELLDAIRSCVIIESALSLVKIHGPNSDRPLGFREDFGIVSRRVVTTAGVTYLAGAFRNLQEPESMNFHGIGTGSTAEASADTALVTELTTEYNPNGTRATGTQSGPSGNVYRSVGTNTVDATAAITEHGLFSSATGGAGTLWDRSVFSVVNLASGDSLQSTYDATFAAGG